MSAEPSAAARAGGVVVFMRELERSFPMADGVVRVLKGIDLVISRGEYVAIIGPSGSGKSTLLSCLGCLERPSAGRYLLEGVDVSALDDDETASLRGRRIGFVFQSYNLVQRLTAAENVALPLFYLHASRREQQRAAESMLHMVGLQDRMHYYPERLSGGERQRVAIARAMVTNPAIILADEPTGALDSQTATEVISTFERVHAAGTTVIMVTHDPQLAARAHRRAKMLDGVITSDERNEP